MALTSISLMAKDVENLSMGLCHTLVKSLCSRLSNSFKIDFVSSLLNFENSLYILDISPSMCDLQLFSPKLYVAHLFTLLIVSFKARFFNFEEDQFINFTHTDYVVGVKICKFFA